MTQIKSKTVEVSKPADEIFDYLKDLRNFQDLLPQDKITDWQGEEGHCSFKVQNMATIELVKKDVTPHSKIHIVSGDKAPFPFTLDIHLKETDKGCNGYLEFNGDLNPFLKMMAERPLTNLFNHIADRLVEVKS